MGQLGEHLFLVRMVNESEETDKSAVCRICARTDCEEMFPIFSEEGEMLDVAEKIGRCLPVIVLPTDKLPQNICTSCLNKLNTSYDLVLTSLASESEFRDKFTRHQRHPMELKIEEGPLQEMEFAEVQDDMQEEFVDEQEEIEELEIILPDEENGETSIPISIRSSKRIVEERKNDKNFDGGTVTETEVALNIYGPVTCDLCNNTFTDMDLFDEHVEKEHLNNSKFQCSRCDESFKESEGLVQHKITSHNEPPVSCARCEDEISDESADEVMEEEWLEEVRFPASEMSQSDDDDDAFTCDLCGKRLQSDEELQEHLQSHNANECNPVCSKCGFKAESWQELTVHKRTHSKDICYVCDICKKTFTDRILCNIHRRNCSKKKFECPHCNRVFLRDVSLRAHMVIHQKENALDCSDCGENFISNEQLVNHKKETHGASGTFECVTCHKVFTNETFYKRHRYIHDPKYWDRFKCQTCQRPFRDANALKSHMQLHYGIKPHMCDLCGRTYNRYANMLKHRKLHKPQNQWEHSCNHCDSKFERLKDLMSHIEHNHEDAAEAVSEDYGSEKKSGMKWICRFCGKRISTKLSLQDHERIHTGAKPFICEWCGREFRSRPNLLQHHLTHTGDRKHACEVCGKRFARKSFITQHMRVHTGEKPFECDLCNKRFTQAGDMRRHRKRHLLQQQQENNRIMHLSSTKGMVHVSPPQGEIAVFVEITQ